MLEGLSGGSALALRVGIVRRIELVLRVVAEPSDVLTAEAAILAAGRARSLRHLGR